MTETAKITLEDLPGLIGDEAPFADFFKFETREIGYGTALVALPPNPATIRPGGTISGPAMFALADYGLWIAVMAAVGPVPLAVTTDMTIHFLRKPDPGTLIGDVRLIKSGRRLAVGTVAIFSEGASEPCAHVTGTYSIPPTA